MAAWTDVLSTRRLTVATKTGPTNATFFTTTPRTSGYDAVNGVDVAYSQATSRFVVGMTY
jgi:hypothetical protein